MALPSAQLRFFEGRKQVFHANGQPAATTASRTISGDSANARAYLCHVAAVEPLTVHHSVRRMRGHRLLAFFCVLGVSLIRVSLPYNPWEGFFTYGSSDAHTDSMWHFTFPRAAEALEQPLDHSEEKGESLIEPVPHAFNPLNGVKFPEGLLQGLQSVDWGTLLSMTGAGLEVALSEARRFAKDLMQSRRVQHFVHTLDIERVGEGFEYLVENLGFKETLPAQLRRERRTLETSFVPIFYFARERVLTRSREADESALKIALEYHQLKAVVKQLEKVPPARNMSTAPQTLDTMHESLLDVVAFFTRSRPVALSLALRVELLTREFADYCYAVFSALIRYISFVNRFHKNRKALFFFAQRTLPRALKILLLLNRLEGFLMQRARSKFAETIHQPGALRRTARRLATHTTGLVSSLESIAHGCLAATSLQFQVDFTRALDAYDHGVDPLVAFKTFLETPNDLRQEEQRYTELWHREHDNTSEKPLQQTQPQPQKHEGKRSTLDVLQNRQEQAGLYEGRQNHDEAPGRGEEQHGALALGAGDFKEMIIQHLNELEDRHATYISEINRTTRMRQAPLARAGGISPGDYSGTSSAVIHTSGVVADAGALLAGLPLDTFATTSPKLFVDTGGGKPLTRSSVESTSSMEAASAAFLASAASQSESAAADPAEISSAQTY